MNNSEYEYFSEKLSRLEEEYKMLKRVHWQSTVVYYIAVYALGAYCGWVLTKLL